MTTRSNYKKILENIFSTNITFESNLLCNNNKAPDRNQQQTNEAFTEKWGWYNQSGEKDKTFKFQKNWYLTLYGFDSETALSKFLRTKRIILDAGCGLGYKAAWFAKMSPESIVLGIDSSDTVIAASQKYSHLENLFFMREDIAKTSIKNSIVDYVNCDQVIMHTKNPHETFKELARILNVSHGEFSCYFYAKKALPRELLDDYFREQCKNMSNDELWEMSKQLTSLGQRLSELNQKIEVPDIPALEIKGGTYDLQRFIYWNFMKCYWNADLGIDSSIATNFDWYSPSNAARFSEQEVRNLVLQNKLTIIYFHSEAACYSGRFQHAKCNK